MKKWSILFAFAACLFLLPISPASAHPPKSVVLQWNPSGTLGVNVSHSVNDPAKHYIYRVVVYVNNNVAMQKEYNAQTNGDGLSDSFSLGALASGTNVKVEAFCVIMGSASGSLTVP